MKSGLDTMPLFLLEDLLSGFENFSGLYDLKVHDKNFQMAKVRTKVRSYMERGKILKWKSKY